MSALACAANMDHYLARKTLFACLLPIWRCFDGLPSPHIVAGPPPQKKFFLLKNDWWMGWANLVPTWNEKSGKCDVSCGNFQSVFQQFECRFFSCSLFQHRDKMFQSSFSPQTIILFLILRHAHSQTDR